MKFDWTKLYAAIFCEDMPTTTTQLKLRTLSKKLKDFPTEDTTTFVYLYLISISTFKFVKSDLTLIESENSILWE